VNKSYIIKNKTVRAKIQQNLNYHNGIVAHFVGQKKNKDKVVDLQKTEGNDTLVE